MSKFGDFFHFFQKIFFQKLNRNSKFRHYKFSRRLC